MAEAATARSTKSSSASTISSSKPEQSGVFIQPMSRAKPIPQMRLREASWETWSSSSRNSQPPDVPWTSSSTLSNLLALPRSEHSVIDFQAPCPPVAARSPETMNSQTCAGYIDTNGITTCTPRTRFNVPLVPFVKGPEQTPKPYQLGLIPALSTLRPHCLCTDRIRLWCPLPLSSGSNAGYELSSPEIVMRVLDLLSHAWMPQTKSGYGTGLLVFHVFCDEKHPPVPEHLRGPASEGLILEFIASCAASFAGDSLSVYVYGVKAWHTVHGMPWSTDKARLKAALTAAAKLAPSSSKRPERPPLMLEMISAIREHLDLSVPLDAAVYACLTMTFWACARLGEFTVPALNAFKPSLHVKRSNVTIALAGPSQLPITSFLIPFMKVAKQKGEVVQWAPQSGSTDPAAALENHFIVNDPPLDLHLFAYRHTNGTFHPLSRNIFLRRIAAAARVAGSDAIQGHSIRIGSVLAYLLRGMPFEAVKVQGRWSSNAFLIYLRKHADILAPYLQDMPVIEPFIRVTMSRHGCD